METKTLAVVTGAKGFIGSNLARDLLSQNIHTVITDLEQADTFRIKDILENKKTHFIPSNVLNMESIQEFIKKVENIVRQNGIERVEFYHPAGYFTYNPHASYDYYHQINVEGTEKVLRILSSSFLAKITRVLVWGSSVVYENQENINTFIDNAGSCAMSNETKSLIKEHLYIQEPNIGRPASRYALSKYLQELVSLEAGERYGLEVCVERPTIVYGPWNTYAIASAIFTMARGELKGIPGPGTAYVSMIHVDDVVSASQYIARHSPPGKVYNIADDGNYTIGELLIHSAQEINNYRKKRNEPELQFNPNFHLPIPLVLLAGKWLTFTSRFTKLPVKIESEAIDLFFGSARFSNERLIKSGYNLKYPDTLIGLTQTIAWYAKQGWI